MYKYQFSDTRCKQLFDAAYPVKHMKGFAWRESPKTLDNHWKRDTAGKTPAEKDELLTVCLLAGEAQTKYRMAQEKAGEKLYRPKGIAVWFNAGGYYDDIGSHAELAEKADAKICSVEGCESAVLGSRFDVCEHHYQFSREGRLLGHLGLIKELRAHYNLHPGLHELRGADAIQFIKSKMGAIGK